MHGGNFRGIKEGEIKLSNLIEPVVISGKSFGIKLLSVYEFLRCDVACRNLINKLTGQGFDRDLCKETCERACIISLSLYDKENQRVFNDGLSVLMEFTPDELRSVYIAYNRLTRKTARFNEMSSKKIGYIKRNYIRSKLDVDSK